MPLLLLETPRMMWGACLQCIDWTLLPRALMGVLALICGNGFIVGLNQIYDVSIDQVNKPFLPIAAGDCAISDVLVMPVDSPAEMPCLPKMFATIPSLKASSVPSLQVTVPSHLY